MENLRKKVIAVAVVGILLAIGSTMHHATAQSAPPSSSGAAPVSIINPLPLPVTGSLGVNGTVNVRDVDNAARKPFQKELLRGYTSGVESFTVPSNQRLTIEFVTGECEMQNSSGIFPPRATFDIQTTVGGTMFPYHFQPIFTIPASSGNNLTTYYYGSTDQTRIYADPGATVSLARTFTGFSCRATLSGYTVAQ